MIIRIDGHEIPVLTYAEMTDEQRATFEPPVESSLAENGRLEAKVLASVDKATMYEVKGELSPGGLTMDYTLVHPPGRHNISMDIASLRPLRAKGRENHQADALHQIRLFHAVGSVTVAGGHVEMAMRKVLVSLRGGKNSDLYGDDVPAEWSRLHDELEKLCRREETELQKALKSLLADADTTRLRERRNDVIHGYWWLVPMSDEFVVARYFHPRSKQPPDNSHVTADSVQRLAGEIFELAAKLEALATPYWPLAIVPALSGYRDPSGTSTCASVLTTKRRNQPIFGFRNQPSPSRVKSQRGQVSSAIAEGASIGDS